MRVLIFTHGFDVNQPHWKDVVWGKPPHQLGRATHALYLAHTYFKDARLGFGSGLKTEHKYKGRTLQEAEYTCAFVRDNLYRITDFKKFENIGFFGVRRLRKLLDDAIFTLNAHNTNTEAEHIVTNTCGERFNGLVVVSDKAHAFRCKLHAAQAMEMGNYVGTFDLFAGMSEAPNAEQTASACVALEPGLDNSNPMGDVVKGYWSLPNEAKPAAIARFNEVIDELKPAG